MTSNKIIPTKPITLVREDFLQSLIDICNQSQLPFFIIEGILKDFLQEIHVASQKQLESDRNKYNQELSKLEKPDTVVDDV